MGLDAVCLAALCHELREVVAGGRVDKIYQPARDEVVLAVRGAENVRLLLSASPNHPRAQITALTRENPDKPPMFCMLLRKHLSGARILGIEQPVLERLLEFRMEATNELGDRVERRLILEVMGRSANLVLLDETGRIVDCLRRVEGDLATGKRQVLPGLFYHLPEPRFGVPPLLERELRFQGVTGDLQERVRALFASVSAGEYIPYMLLRDGKPVDFSCMPILQYGPETELKKYDTFATLLDDFYETREQTERIRQRGQDLIKTVTAARDRTARKLGNQQRELTTATDRESKRVYGDLITAQIYRMERGMQFLRTENFYDPISAEVEIPLDPLLSPQQNAAKYYKDYNKAKTAERVLKEQIAKGESELAYLNSVLEQIPFAEGERDLQELRQELAETGYLRRQSKGKQRQKPVAGQPMEFRSSGGLAILVGKNNSQNDRLTTKIAEKADLWFHTQKIHGSHVILRLNGAQPDAQSMTEAAILAAYYSQGREGNRVAVDYTPVKFIKKPSGAKPGMVVYTTYQTAYVQPDGDLVKKLRCH
ncbi:MAG: NFACT family protein [Oscillospiraceae bacterium]|nr:NFACT family protein [Oscillospiraceae bacterium]